MRLNPLVIALFALLVGTGGALAFWVVDDTGQRSRCAAPAFSQDPQPEPPAPQDRPPRPDHELDRPSQPQPVAAPAQPQPAPMVETTNPRTTAGLTSDELGQRMEAEAARIQGRDVTESDMQRLRELAAEMVKRMEEEELAKFAFQFTATISGTVIDSSGSGVPGATVLLATVVQFKAGSDKETERLRKSVSRSGTPRATTDAAGNFRIDYRQGFNREVESIAFSLSPQGTDRTLGDKVSFVLRDGESTTGQRLELPATGSITGRVVTSNGQAAAGAKVMARLDAPAGNMAAPGRRGGGAGVWVAADAQGRFVVPALLDGKYRLSAAMPGFVLQAGDYPAIVTSNRETELASDLVLVMETALKITLTCQAYNPENQSMRATFYDGQGNRLSASAARVGPGGVTLFGNAPTQAVCFELSGGVFLTTNRIACNMVAGAHYDAGSLELTMREMPKRGEVYDGNASRPAGETVKIKSRD